MNTKDDIIIHGWSLAFAWVTKGYHRDVLRFLGHFRKILEPSRVSLAIPSQLNGTRYLDCEEELASLVTNKWSG